MKVPTRVSVLFFIGVFAAGSTALGYYYYFVYSPPLKAAARFMDAMEAGDERALRSDVIVSSDIDDGNLREPEDRELSVVEENLADYFLVHHHSFQADKAKRKKSFTFPAILRRNLSRKSKHFRSNAARSASELHRTPNGRASFSISHSQRPAPRRLVSCASTRTALCAAVQRIACRAAASAE